MRTLSLSPLSLTEREHDVVALVRRGLGTKEVARALGISPNTVKDHLARIYAKAEVTGRVELLRVLDGPGAPQLLRATRRAARAHTLICPSCRATLRVSVHALPAGGVGPE